MKLSLRIDILDTFNYTNQMILRHRYSAKTLRKKFAGSYVDTKVAINASTNVVFWLLLLE